MSYITALGTYRTEGGPEIFTSYALPSSGASKVAQVRNSLCTSDSWSSADPLAPKPIHNYKVCMRLEPSSGGVAMWAAGNACASRVSASPGSPGGRCRQTPLDGWVSLGLSWGAGMAGGWAPLGSIKGSFTPGTLFRRSGCVPGVTVSRCSQTVERKHRLCACSVTVRGSEARGWKTQL